MDTSRVSVAPCLHSDDRGAPEAAPDQGTGLLTLAERFLAVTDLPDDVAALRRLVGDQAVSMAKLLIYVDRLEARVARQAQLLVGVEGRVARLERQGRRP